MENSNIKVPANIQEMEPMSIDLVGDYWTPQSEGETKRLVFSHIDLSKSFDIQNQDKEVELETAYFVEPTADGGYKTLRNSSRRLVGALESSQIKQGTPLQITYKGKKKNSTNSYMSDSWSIQILVVKGGQS